MSKKIAIIVPNPVNGYGLFAYLEACYEKGVEAKTFAVNTKPAAKTNSGYDLTLNATIGELKGKEAEFDGVVFACGDAVPKLNENMGKPEYQDMMAVIKNFNALDKKLAGHCAAGLIFEMAGITEGKKLAVVAYPPARAAIKQGVVVDEDSAVGHNLHTAKDECCISSMIPQFLESL